jgi:hypothetical protein
MQNHLNLQTDDILDFTIFDKLQVGTSKPKKKKKKLNISKMVTKS